MTLPSMSLMDSLWKSPVLYRNDRAFCHGEVLALESINNDRVLLLHRKSLLEIWSLVKGVMTTLEYSQELADYDNVVYPYISKNLNRVFYLLSGHSAPINVLSYTSSWVSEGQIACPTPQEGGMWGNTVMADATGTRLLVTQPKWDITPNTANQDLGRVYVFRKDPGGWVQEFMVQGADNTVAWLGTRAAINTEGNLLCYVTAPLTAYGLKGTISIWSRATGTNTWTNIFNHTHPTKAGDTNKWSTQAFISSDVCFMPIQDPRQATAVSGYGFAVYTATGGVWTYRRDELTWTEVGPTQPGGNLWVGRTQLTEDNWLLRRDGPNISRVKHIPSMVVGPITKSEISTNLDGSALVLTIMQGGRDAGGCWDFYTLESDKYVFKTRILQTINVNGAPKTATPYPALINDAANIFIGGCAIPVTVAQADPVLRVYDLISGGWVFRNDFTASTYTMDGSGNKIAYIIYNNTPPTVRVTNFVGGAWVTEQDFSVSWSGTSENAPVKIAMSKGGTRLFCSYQGGFGDTVPNGGGFVRVYRKDATWVLETTFYCQTINGIAPAYDAFGSTFSISNDATKIAIGAPDKSSNASIPYMGAVYTWTRAGNNWTYEGAIVGSEYSQGLGKHVTMSPSGGALMVVEGFSSKGAVGHYAASGGTWIGRQVIDRFTWNSGTTGVSPGYSQNYLAMSFAAGVGRVNGATGEDFFSGLISIRKTTNLTVSHQEIGNIETPKGFSRAVSSTSMRFTYTGKITQTEANWTLGYR